MVFTNLKGSLKDHSLTSFPNLTKTMLYGLMPVFLVEFDHSLNRLWETSGWEVLYMRCGVMNMNNN